MIYKRKWKKFNKGSQGCSFCCGVYPCGWGWVSVLWCFPGWGSLCLFWLMELDLISLKGSAASRSRLWSVHGFSMPFGSRSCFRGVRSVYVHLCFRVALSAYPQCRQYSTCPWDHHQCFFPCPALRCWQKLVGRCLCGSFCVVATCVGCPRPPGSPSASWDSCALVSASQAHTLCCGACVPLCWLPTPALCFAGLVGTCFSSSGWPLHRRDDVHFFPLTTCQSLYLYIYKQFSKKEEETRSWAFFFFNPVEKSLYKMMSAEFPYESLARNRIM